MKALTRLAPLLLLALAGCTHRSANPPILEALRPMVDQFVDDDPRVEYLTFVDFGSATFLSPRVPGRYKSYWGFTPGCPTEPPRSWRGYQLRGRVVSVSGDSAEVSIDRLCYRNLQIVHEQERLLVLRKGSEWKFEKVLQEFTPAPKDAG